MSRYGIYSEHVFVTSCEDRDAAIHQCDVEAYYNQNVTHIVVDRISHEILYECECNHNFYYSIDKGKSWYKIFHDDIVEVLDI